jgi:hypothetical protein
MAAKEPGEIPQVNNVTSRKIRVRIHVHTLRQHCEHFALIGASVDAFAASFKLEVWGIILLGKFAFVVGSAAILLMHAEEAKREYLL